MSKLTTLRLQDANSLKEIQFLGYYNFWTVCLLKTIQFIFLCVASHLCWLEGGMSHCLCSICNNIELWERDKPHHLSAQISNQLAEIKAHEGTWWACLCKSNPPPPEVSLVWMNISGDNERAGQRVTGLLEWFALISIISTVSIKPSPVFSSKGAHRTPEGRSAESATSAIKRLTCQDWHH